MRRFNVYNSRKRGAPSDGGGYNPSPFGGEYGTTPAQSGILRLPPADLLPVSPGDVTRLRPGMPPSPITVLASLGVLQQPALPAFDRMRYCSFTQIPLSLTTADQLVLPRPTQIRVYLAFLNTDAAASIFINFGTAATPLSMPFAPANGFEWLFTVPQDDIHMVGSATPTVGTLIFAELPPG
jgi:hypothetical protein